MNSGYKISDKPQPNQTAALLRSHQKYDARQLMQDQLKEAMDVLNKRNISQNDSENVIQAACALQSSQTKAAHALEKSHEEHAQRLKNTHDNYQEKLAEKNQIISWLSGDYSV